MRSKKHLQGARHFRRRCRRLTKLLYWWRRPHKGP